MSVMTNQMERLILNTLRGTTAAAPVAVYIGLFLSDPGESGSGTEITYTGYARQQVTFSAPTASGSDVSMTNTDAVVFAQPSSAAGTITHIGLMDAATGGNMLVHIPLVTPIATAGDFAPTIKSGVIRIAMEGGQADPAFKTKILNFLRGTNVSGFSPYLALYSGNPTGGGTELSGSGYARIPLTFGAPVEQLDGKMQISNTNDTESAECEENLGDWAYGVICDNETGGNRVFFAQNNAVHPMVRGSTVVLSAGSITVSLD